MPVFDKEVPLSIGINMSKIECIYVSRTLLPSTSASAVHVMKLSEELNFFYSGNFEIIIVNKREPSESICTRYGVNAIRIVETGLDIHSCVFSYRFAFWVVRYAIKNKIKRVITRDPFTAFMMQYLGKEVVLDLHGDLRQLCGRMYHLFKCNVLVRKIHFIAISNNLKQYYIQCYGSHFKRLVVCHDGVTVSNFSNIEIIQETDLSKPKIGYFGKFTEGKGIRTIQEIASECNQLMFYMFGGTREEAEETLNVKFSNNVIFEGYVENKDVPSLMKNMSIVLLPNKSGQMCNNEFIGDFTSPLKMFEYMASGRPIIASNIQVLREVLDETNCYLVSESNKNEWIAAIDDIIHNPSKAVSIATKARQDVNKYTWKDRAFTIINLLK